MPWQEVSIMSQRREFVMFAQAEEANIQALCAHYGISRKTGYKWLRRFGAAGVAGFK
jgi:transposase-like protein